MDERSVFSKLPTISLLYLFFFFITSVGLSSSFRLSNETDRQALLAIKDTIPGDPLGFFSSWNQTVHFCRWQGVTCGGRLHPQRVTMINLSSLQLAGSLSPHIGNLTFLRTINLSSNSFHGDIPQEIGRLFRLQHLVLQKNLFRGEFPTNLTHCPNLEVIFVDSNNLEGKIPTILGSMPNLLKLDLHGNNFTGTIPPSLGNLSTLHALSLAINNLHGNIPFEPGQLSKLEVISLGPNNLSGVVPTFLYNISSISIFSISGNRLHGMIPPDLGLTLPNLKEIYVAGNQFYGPLPVSLANASGLRRIEFAANAFIGPIPLNWATLPAIEVLRLFKNKLRDGDEGSNLMNFITRLSNCSNLKALDLSVNPFKGVLPHSIANLSSKIAVLGLTTNYLFGNIPLGIGNLVNLRVLALAENMLTGSIPDSIGKLSKLGQLYIYRTKVSGEIPSSIGNLSQLSILGLQKNILEGSIPVSLGNCIGLQGIDLQHNRLTSPIPKQIFDLPSLSSGVYLNDNNLTGLLPLEVGNLKNLGLLDVSKNELYGEIPATLGSCQVLEVLFMDGNFFRGTIPESFQQLKGIRILDLSRNNLSGQIPNFLGEFTSLDNLNLSYNKFDGEVPNRGLFTNISAFSVVGNNKLCGGIKALELPSCPVKAFERRKKSWIHKVKRPVAMAPSVVILLLLCLAAFTYRIRRSRVSRRQMSSASPFQNEHPKLSYAQLLHATNGFSFANLIGEGRYGLVYKGIVDSIEQTVAVKVLNLQQCGANKSFMAECQSLRTIRHRNLVKIITSCSSLDFKGGDFKALVFEFMANGSLERWLHPSLLEHQEPKSLNIVQRLNIAIDVASALDYVHNHCETTIIHCDLKPSNILLDDDLCAHVSDFGLARILSVPIGISCHQQSSSISIKGTVGYIAPEYGMGAQVSTQGDMYSYGVLLLEMFTGKRPTDNMFIDGNSIRSYAKMSLPDKVMDLVDPGIIEEKEEGEESSRTRENNTIHLAKVEVCLASVLQIGVSCSAELPSERMNANDVLMELHKIMSKLLGRCD